ncbi:MAG: virulence RhuM family protein [Bacteroidales bacterium]|nr:virulence RhuM family protein [Bacteroidales bacterium]
MEQGEIVIYKTSDENNFQLEVRVENETVWLNRQQIAQLFSRDVKTIGKHITNALKEELKSLSVVAKFATTASDGKTYQVEYYSLDMIISIGYRVKSERGVLFRIWANKVLKEYLFDESVLTLLSKRNPDVGATIFTANIFNQFKLDLKRYNAQYSKIEVKQFKKSHDRFLIIDNETVYHIGASLKDLGKKWFAFSKINLKAEELLKKLED